MPSILLGSVVPVAVALLIATSAVAAQEPLANDGQPSSLVPAQRTDKAAIAREQECVHRARAAEPARVVFVGDSITQSWEGPGRDAWQQHIAPLGALNLGNSGDRTEHVLWRLQQAPLTRLSPEHVVLLIGTNNLGHKTSTALETLAGVEAVVKVLLEQCPKARIHVLEIFPRGEQLNPMRGDICQINQALRAFVRAAAAAPGVGERLRIHAIGDRFAGADGAIDKEIMPDYLHLSSRGYTMWAEAMLPLLAR